MSKYNGATIQITRWDDFNPRKDITSPTWFRINHGIFEEPKFYKLEGADWACLLYFMCQVSKTNKNCSFVLDAEHAKRIAQLKGKQIDFVIDKLQQSQFLTVDVTSTNADVTFVALTDERTDVTDTGSANHPLVEIWNRHRGALTEVRGCTGKRKAAAEARWNENPSTEYWSEIVIRMARSSFCRGEKNQPGSHAHWKASFDFLIRPDTQHKVMEGKYDDAPTSPPPATPRKLKGMEEIDAMLKGVKSA